MDVGKISTLTGLRKHMNTALIVEKNIIQTLLKTDGEPISLTGLKLVINEFDTEQINAIVQRLCLKQIVSIRTMSDSINGDCKSYYITRKQKGAAQELLQSLRETVERQEDGTLETLPSVERQILMALLRDKKPKTAKEIKDICKKGEPQVMWRLQLLARNEWISSRIEHGRVKTYFLNDEQAISAALECEKEYRIGIFSKDNLHQAINDVSEEFVRAQTQRKELDAQLDGIEKNIKLEQTQIERTRESIKTKQEKLKELRLTKDRLVQTLGISISKSQGDPVLIAERLSFLRNLQSRPVLAPLSALREIIGDYEVALALTRRER